MVLSGETRTGLEDMLNIPIHELCEIASDLKEVRKPRGRQK